MKRKVYLAFGCAAVLAGCGAPAVHYHTLASSSGFALPSRTHADFALEVTPVSVPASLDQAYLAIRSGQTEIEFLDDERWASPLGNEIRSAISARLASRWNTSDAAGSSTSSGKPVAALKVEIRQLDVWPGNRVQLTAGWRLSFPDRKDRILSCMTQLEEPVRVPGYDGLVRAQRAAVLKLADVIGANAVALDRATGNRCAGVPGDRAMAGDSSE